jgi:hypothetical protein
VDRIARHGIVASRSRSIIALAKAQASPDLCLDTSGHRDPDASIRRLAEIPGIGQWTAHYIAMRALRWPDAFPKEDIAVRKRSAAFRRSGRRAVAGVAAMAQLRGDAPLAHGGLGTGWGPQTVRVNPDASSVTRPFRPGCSAQRKSSKPSRPASGPAIADVARGGASSCSSVRSLVCRCRL